MDISLIRKTGNPDLVRESQRRRGAPVDVVDKIQELDEVWRKLRFDLDAINSEFNIINSSIAQAKKEKKDCQEFYQKAKETKAKQTELKSAVVQALQDRDDVLYSVGNLVHQSVPVSNNEADNEVVSKWGTVREQTDDLKHHHQLLYMIGGYDPETGAKVAGHRGYYLQGFGMLLNQALLQHGLRFLHKKGYTHIQTPFFMKQSAMKKVAALAEFDEALYKVTGGTDENGKEETEPCYLIATSEQPICALNAGKSFVDKDLPLKYAGFSTCFRKEAGSHGRDAWGIFRVHQFEKIEQFVVCHPDKSWEQHDEMLKISEEFYQQLGLPYHVVNIVSGELNNAASKKYDLEAWFPTLACYRELVSCSNCTDYQARRLDVKYGTLKSPDGTIPYVHMLNSTLCATERTLCCILENYQCETGIRVPEVLKPYIQYALDDLEDPNIIPFVRDMPPLGKGAKGQKKK